MAVIYSRAISSNAIHTNGKENVQISASGTLNNIYPLGKPGKKCCLSAASGATVTVSGSAGNIKMRSTKTMPQYSTLHLMVDASGTYWVPVGGWNANA